MKFILLDRDGVINEDSDDYIKSPEEWTPIPGSLEAIARLTQAGYKVFVASNQSGLGRGLFDYDAFAAINARMMQKAGELGGQIHGMAFAPEHPDDASDMRKPNPGMLRDIARRLQLALEGVPFVGDSWSDVLAARTAGASPVLVRSGKGRDTETRHRHDLQDVAVYDDLAAFVSDWLG